MIRFLIDRKLNHSPTYHCIFPLINSQLYEFPIELRYILTIYISSNFMYYFFTFCPFPKVVIPKAVLKFITNTYVNNLNGSRLITLSNNSSSNGRCNSVRSSVTRSSSALIQTFVLVRTPF